MRVLIVVKNELDSSNVQEAVASIAGEIISVDDGRTALQLTKNLEEQPIDLLIVELTPPGAHAFEIARELKRRWRPVKIILITDRSDSPWVFGGANAAGVDTIAKNFHPDSIRTALATLSFSSPLRGGA